jgi:zinc/manganese transport system permease protein
MSGDPHLRWNVIEDVRQLLEFHFMRNALLAGTVVAILAAVIGWFMVLRRQAFAGHTLAVVGFPGAAGAVWLGISATTGYYGFCIVAALIIAVLPRDASGAPRSEESAVIGVVQAFALACGFLFVSLYKGFLGGVNALLFGSFLGITDAQVVALVCVAAGALLIFAVIGRPLLFASVDAQVAAARAVPVRLLATVFLVLLGVTAAAVSQITGSLLVFALLVMPAATAQRLTTRPGWSVFASVVIALVVTWLGLGVAYFSIYPIGFYVSSFAFAGFVLATIWRALQTRRGQRLRLNAVPA